MKEGLMKIRLFVVWAVPFVAGVTLSGCTQVSESAPSEPTMGDYSLEQFKAEAAELPTGLTLALERDRGISGVEYLAQAAAVVDASEVLDHLFGQGVKVEGAYLDGTELRIPAESARDRAAIERAGAIVTAVAFTAPTPPYDSSRLSGSIVSDALVQPGGTTPVRGGLPYGGQVNGVYQVMCSIGFMGWDVATGTPQFLTAGECATRSTAPYSLAIVPNAGVDSGTPGLALGSPVTGVGLNEPDGVSLFPIAAPAAESGTVAVWGTGMGAPNSGTPVSVKGFTNPVVGATICKSALQTGWRCGTITGVTAGYTLDGFHEFPHIISDLCSVRAELGSPAMVGNLAVGILTTSTWSHDCSASQGAPQVYSAFIPMSTPTGHEDGAIDVLAGKWELMTTDAVPTVWPRTTGTAHLIIHPPYGGDGPAITGVHVSIDGGACTAVIAMNDEFYLEGPDSPCSPALTAGTHTYSVHIVRGVWNVGPAKTGSFTL